ncbi:MULTISPECIES: hypothetical protein [Bacteroides]|nr:MULTISPECIES: hypothetical protein [Bacteroides]
MRKKSEKWWLCAVVSAVEWSKGETPGEVKVSKVYFMANRNML